MSKEVFWTSFLGAVAFFIVQPMIAKYSGGIVPAS